jgi:hypothetical protein
MPPDNGQYLLAAYLVAGVVYLGYALWLVRRGGRQLGE